MAVTACERKPGSARWQQCPIASQEFGILVGFHEEDHIAGTGRSLAQVMSTADGHFALALGNGSVSGLMVSLAGLQIFDALVLYVTGNNRIPVKCAMGRLNFKHGDVAFERTLLDT